jgi:hypothetical protein
MFVLSIAERTTTATRLFIFNDVSEGEQVLCGMMAGRVTVGVGVLSFTFLEGIVTCL